MANASGTITNAQGWVTIDASLNDTITFTPTGGSYTVEYPARTTAISASSSAQTLSVAAGGQVRMLCISGSLAWARTDNNDGGPLDTSERAAVRALVSGDWTPGPALMTLAEMLAYVPPLDGSEAYVTDLPSGTRGRFYWHEASAKWRPAGMILVDRSLTLDSGVNNASEQYIKSVSVPAGLLFTGCEIYIEYTLARSNTTDAGAAAQFRIGNAGTISDGTTSAGSGFANLSSTTRSFGNSHRYRVVSATQLQKIGTPTPVASSFANSSSSLAADTLLTVGDTTARLYFSPTVQLAAATGSTLPQVGYSALWLLPS